MRPRVALLFLSLLPVAPLACREATRSDSAVAGEVHAPFSALTFDQALAQAKATGRVVMLDFTASWCPPCREMERSTWPDASVQDWVAHNAVAIQLDTDKEPQRASSMGITGIPTVIFLEPTGRELGRFSGYRSPSAFLDEARKHAPAGAM